MKGLGIADLSSSIEGLLDMMTLHSSCRQFSCPPADAKAIRHFKGKVERSLECITVFNLSFMPV